MEKLVTTAIGGIRYLMPFIINLDIRIDSKLRPQIALSREMMIFRRLALFGSYEYQADFGWIADQSTERAPGEKSYRKEVSWDLGLEYFLSKHFSLMGSYNNIYGAGGGLSMRF
jgi:hypothetical protein